MKTKCLYLEGMRALMAINVILCHFVCVYYPQMYFTEQSGPLSCFATTPLSVLVNGNIAVVFFFALTGVLVGRSVFLKDIDITEIPTKAGKRYSRLLPVVVLATLFTFITMMLGLQCHLEISDEAVNTEFLAAYCNFRPTVISLFSHSFFWPFVDYSAYVGPFWTISYELWGYIIVFLMAMSLKNSKWRRFVYLVLIPAIYVGLDEYYCVFVLGLLVADLEFNQNPTIGNKWCINLKKNKIFILLVICLSVYFSCCPMNEASPLYSFWFDVPMVTHILLRGMGISMFVWAIFNLNLLQKILSIKPLVKLGTLSFETYALHWPIMLSFGARAFLLSRKYMSYGAAAGISFVVTLIITYVLSLFLRMVIKQINKGTVALKERFLKKCLNR